MEIVVCLRTVLDPLLPVKVAGLEIVADDEEPVYTLVPDDRAALELAIAWKEQHGAKVTALAVGTDVEEQTLRFALARGADCAVHLLTGEEVSGAGRAQIAAGFLGNHLPDLILCGDRSLADEETLFGPFLAERLGWAQITRAVSIERAGERVRVQRRLERGDREVVSAALPVVITVGAAGIEPRYVPLLALEAARSAAVEIIEMETPEIPDGFTVAEVGMPRPRPRRMAMPASSMSAAQRMSFLMGGGAAKTVGSKEKLFEGTPDAAAEKIVQFLQEQGLL